MRIFKEDIKTGSLYLLQAEKINVDMFKKIQTIKNKK